MRFTESTIRPELKAHYCRKPEICTSPDIARAEFLAIMLAEGIPVLAKDFSQS
jgi:hypothetical protein